MPGKIDEWQAAGFSQRGIDEYIHKKSFEWRAAGFGQEEIDEYLGKQPFDSEGMEDLVYEIADQDSAWRTGQDQPGRLISAVSNGLLKSFEGSWEERHLKAVSQAYGVPEEELRAAPGPMGPSSNLGTFLKHGFQSSVTGLAYRNKLPDPISEELLEHMGTDQRFFYSLGTLAGDLPFIVAGGLITTRGAGALHPVGAAVALGGGFGLTEGIRKVYMDRLEKGQIASGRDFVHRLMDALWEMEKGFTVGLATGAAGAGSAGIKRLAKEVPTLVGVSSALEMRLPEPQEFFDAAVLLTGLHGLSGAAKVLRTHWTKTGEPPGAAAVRIVEENQRELPYLIRREPELGEKAWRPEPFASVEGPEPPQHRPPLRPDQLSALRRTGPPSQAELFGVDLRLEEIEAEIRSRPSVERAGRGAELPPESVQTLTGMREEVPTGKAWTPEQRFWEGWRRERATDARSMRVQDIVDEGRGQVRRGEEEKPWDLRAELQKVIDAARREEGAISLEPLGELGKKVLEGAEEIKKVAEKLGLAYRGYWKDLEAHSFTDKETGGDFTLKGEVRAERLLEEVQQVRGEFEGTKKIPGDPLGVGEPKEPSGLQTGKGEARIYEAPEGYAEVEIFSDRLTIHDVFVEGEARGKGLATRLVDAALKENPQLPAWIASTSKGMDRVAEKLGFERAERAEAPEEARFSNARVWRRGPRLSGLLGSEDGFIDLRALREALERTKDFGKELREELPWVLKFPYFQGKEGLKALQNWRSKMITQPFWYGKLKDPGFRPYWEIQRRGDEMKSEIAFRFLDKVRPLFRLFGEDYKGYKRITLESDRRSYEFESLRDYTEKTGDTISQKAFDVYKVVRGAFNEALEFQVNELRRSGAEEGSIQELLGEVGELKGYFPRVRSGKYFVEATKEGAPRVRAQYNNEGELAQIIKGLREEGYTVKEQGEVPKLPEEMYSRMDVASINALLDVATEKWSEAQRNLLFKEVSDVLKSRGYLARGIKRGKDYVKGFEEENLKKVVAEHFLGLAGMVAKAERSRAFRERFQRDFQEGKLSNAQKELIGKYVTDMLSPTSPYARASSMARALIFAKYLGLSIPSGIVNLTGNAICAFPALSLQTKGASVKLTNAFVDIANHTTGGAVAKLVESKTGELYDYSPLKAEEIRALRIGLQQGWNQALYTQELMGHLNQFGTAGKVASRIIGEPMGVTEKWNRLSTALAAFRVFRYEKGLPFEEALTQAKELTNTAHGVFGKSNLPGLFRGGAAQDLARTAYTFRTYTHHWIGLVSHLAREDPKAVAKMAAVTLALGGLSGFPGLKSVEGVLSRYGVNPRSDLKEWLEDQDWEEYTEALLYGLPGALGIDLTGSIGIEPPGQRELGAGQPEEILGEVALDLFGVPAGIAQDFLQSAEQLYHGDFGRAFEESPFTPQVLARYLAGTRMEEQGLVTRRGDIMRDELGQAKRLSPQATEMKKFPGFQPTELSEHYRTYEAQKAEKTRWAREKKKLSIAWKKSATDPDKGLTHPDSIEKALAIAKFNAELLRQGVFYVEPIDTMALIREVMPIAPVSKNQFFLNQEIR